MRTGCDQISIKYITKRCSLIKSNNLINLATIPIKFSTLLLTYGWYRNVGPKKKKKRRILNYARHVECLIEISLLEKKVFIL